ncbi:hypothetical protein SAMN05660282_00366 [Corynebacterium spheniscorum]|uniref:Uncharacterized protein n=1 Tax=Corynebacterium spheniscorum TaxID=185761 RepID=A0A1I2QGS6_9CORY|nr:hypothetical protein SAMN05660282_00366 [Corynebacterium spheniscorum]
MTGVSVQQTTIHPGGGHAVFSTAFELR